jgi:hypothetical protein
MKLLLEGAKTPLNVYWMLLEELMTALDMSMRIILMPNIEEVETLKLIPFISEDHILSQNISTFLMNNYLQDLLTNKRDLSFKNLLLESILLTIRMPSKPLADILGITTRVTHDLLDNLVSPHLRELAIKISCFSIISN